MAARGARWRHREKPPGANQTTGVSSEGQQHVHDLLAVARLLDIGDLATSAVSDAGLGDLAGVDHVIRGFREEDSFVVDFVRPKGKRALAAAAVAGGEPGKETGKDVGKDAGKGVQPPAKAEGAAHEPAADHAAPPAAQAAPAAPAAQAPAHPPAQAAPQAPAQAAAAEPAAKPAPAVASAGSTRDVGITTARNAAGGRVTFSFAQRTAAAAFDANGTMTVVFDSQQNFDPATLPGQLGDLISKAQVERQANAVVLRFQMAQQQISRLSPDGANGWVLTIGEPALTATDSALPQRGVDGAGQTVVSLAMADVSGVHWITMPDSRAPWAVVTAMAPGRGVAKPYRFVEFDLPQTAQGVVVTPRADDIIVRSDIKDVVISRDGGLTLSPQAKVAEAKDESAPQKIPQYILRDSWGEWRLGPTRERLREMGRKTAEGPRSDRSDGRLKLAAMMLANDLASEAMGPLNSILIDDATMRMDRRVLLLKGIAQLMLARDQEAMETLSTGLLKNDVEASMWRAIGEVHAGQFAKALPSFRRGAELLDNYPDAYQAVLREHYIRAAVAMREFGLADAELKALSDLPRDIVARDRVALMKAMVDEASGRPESAIIGYKALFDSEIRPVAAEAGLRGVTLAMREKSPTITPDQGLEKLETLSVIWRGDELEIATLGELGRIYADQKRWRDAFGVAKRANALYTDHPITRALHERTAEQFATLFTSENAEALSKIDALALFYDFRDFLPVGRKGDEITRRLSDRLVELDLLDQAADLLQYQIDRRLTGAARSAIAARLAMIRLLNRKPAEALAVLHGTRLAEMPSELKRARLLLEAKALSDLSRTDLAVEVLGGETGPEIDRLKADILWSGRRWREAGEAHELMLGDSWRGDGPLEDRSRSDVMRAAMAYVMADEGLSLDRLRSKYAARMAETPDARAFAFITSANRAKPSDMRELARSVATADTISEFMQEYRKRYPDFATAKRLKAEAAKAAKPEDAPKPEPVPEKAKPAGAPQAENAPAEKAQAKPAEHG